MNLTESQRETLIALACILALAAVSGAVVTIYNLTH